VGQSTFDAYQYSPLRETLIQLAPRGCGEEKVPVYSYPRSKRAGEKAFMGIDFPTRERQPKWTRRPKEA